jgi:hypothetical protein
MKSMPLQTLNARQDAWSAHLQDMFASLEIPSGPLADNLAASVAMYCRKFHPQGVHSCDLKLLLARSFCAVGDLAAAGRILESMQPHRRHVSRWLEILSELHHFPQLLPYFSLGVIRPADWAGAQLDRMWTLDFGRLTLSAAEKHEMMLYRSIRAIIEKTEVFWDATRGEGLLGVKELSALMVESDDGRRQTLTAADDLIDYMTDLLLQAKEKRGWHSVPVLLNLDL